MKLQPDKIDAPAISGYGPGWISIGAERISRSVAISSRGQRMNWPCRRFADLDDSHFTSLLQWGPELIVFGSGGRLRFPKPSWLGGLMDRRIGIETMDTQAACRTYNILAAEGRHVVAALLLEDEA